MSAALTKYVTPDEVYLQARRSNIRKRVQVVFKNPHWLLMANLKQFVAS